MLHEIKIIKEKEILPIIGQVAELEITGPEKLSEATDILTSLNQWNDEIEEDRLKLTKPINESLKAINGKYKPWKDLLTNAIASVRLKMGDYRTEALKAQQEETERLAGRVGEGKGYLKAETAIRKIEELGTVDKTVDSGDGKVTFVEKEAFVVEDMKLLPLQYHLPNEVAIRKAMREGLHLEGVRYFKEQQVRNTR